MHNKKPATYNFFLNQNNNFFCDFKKTMLNKFRGTFYGALVGDCFGALFQESSILSKGSRLVLKKCLDDLERTNRIAGLRKSYTDDTALTLAVARTIKTCKQIDQKTLAINFVNEFYRNPYRDFKSSTIEIITRFKRTNLQDVLSPAKEMLTSDAGSNSIAMYVAPIALICCKNVDLNLREQIEKAAALTEVHNLAVEGAVLQANAIRSLVKCDGQLNIDIFLNEILDSIEIGASKREGPSFDEQIAQVKKLLTIENPSEERVVDVLGHSHQALYSVPTAIYCFLRGIKYQNDNNSFRQAIEYAITLGGHSNTITSMTGALCGAYYGDSIILPNLLDQCEGLDEIKEISDHLYEM